MRKTLRLRSVLLFRHLRNLLKNLIIRTQDCTLTTADFDLCFRLYALMKDLTSALGRWRIGAGEKEEDEAEEEEEVKGWLRFGGFTRKDAEGEMINSPRCHLRHWAHHYAFAWRWRPEPCASVTLESRSGRLCAVKTGA